MSELVYSRHGGYLTIAEYAADERQIQALLREFDHRLRLTWEVDQRTGRQVWNVVAVWSPEHPAHQILTWRDETTLEPYPLTSRIVDEVKRLRQHDTLKASDAANARLKEQVGKQTYDDTYEVVSDFERMASRGRVHVSHTVNNPALVAAKRRGREQGRAA